MNISGISDIARVTKASGFEPGHGLVNEPTRADIELFNSLMNGGGAETSTESGAFLAEAVGRRMGSVDQLSQDAMRSMKKATKDIDSQSVAEVSRALSQYSLEMAVTTKVINKGSQAIEKLTNLQ